MAIDNHNFQIYSGILIIDKPGGPTSADVLRRLKRKLGSVRLGHTGTLDPLATGVLPVCIGVATKLVPYMKLEPKKYQGSMQLGIETDSWDITGKVVSKNAVPEFQQSLILELFARFDGRQLLEPPMFSAIKYKGRPLYTYAREGKTVQVPPREVLIGSFRLLHIENDILHFELVCSRGTYVRSIVQKVGKLLGCGACLVSLRRLQSGRFCIEDAFSLGQLEEIIDGNTLWERLLSPAQALDHLASYELNESSRQKVSHGNTLLSTDLEISETFVGHIGDKVRLIEQGQLAAIAEIHENSKDLFFQLIRVSS